MGLEAWLLERLACPACRSAVKERGQDEGLECTACRRVYPVEGGIPIMIVSEDAQREDAFDEREREP